MNEQLEIFPMINEKDINDYREAGFTQPSANAKQVGGNHYKSTMECWDYILSNQLGYLEGTAIKYITRHRKKNGVEDIKKAIHFLEKLIEVEEAKKNT